MTSSRQIRSSFIDFFKDRGHDYIPSSPIVPIGDETLLFANAGMNQFKDIFVGLREPKCKRAANSQKCLRVSGKHNDLEEVGKDTYHHTFFEMLGNWSFGDYFKAEAIEWAWDLVVNVWGIDPDKLYATVFAGNQEDGLPEDTEAAQLWTKLTPISPERVRPFGKKDNFWEMGNVGPCGPCSELHIDLGPGRCDMQHVPGHKCDVNAGCSRFIELWNLVFIQYNRAEDGRLTPLKAKYIDTGAGLERVASVMQNKTSNYDTDLFMPIIEAMQEMTGHKYTSKLGNHTDNSFRVVADHVRAMVFAITDGAVPSNDGRGYVIRRILRRAARYGRELGMHEPFMHRLVPVVVGYMGDAFSEIKDRADYVTTVIESEEASFGRTLDRGLEIFNQAADKAQKGGKAIIDGEQAFQLYDTFGFPLDLTQLLARERGLDVDTSSFSSLMQQQRERARAAQSQKGAGLMMALADAELPATEDLHKYVTDSCEALVVGWAGQKEFVRDGQLNAGQEAGLVIDKTCFYAESGGQVGDCGTIESDTGKFIVEDTVKIADSVIHRGRMHEGTITSGQTVTAKVSKDRQAIKKNHTATHLMQWALQQVCGDSIAQQGSLVSPDYLRFDFTSPKALTREQLTEVEKIVREKIAANEPVTCQEMPKEHAEKLGAMALFGEKYGDTVRVVAIGTDGGQVTEAFSKEFCGGTHVDKLGVIGGFKIIKEESVSAGVRRITALTGQGLNAYLEQRSDAVEKMCAMLKVPAEEVVTRIEKLIDDNKELAKKLKNAAKQQGGDVLADARTMLDNCIKIGDHSIIVGRLDGATLDSARTAIDMLKKKAPSSAILLGFVEEDKVTLLAGVTDDLIKKGVKAGDIVKQVAPIVDGGGGGKPQMAQAGGKNPAKLDEAIAAAKDYITSKLG